MPNLTADITSQLAFMEGFTMFIPLILAFIVIGFVGFLIIWKTPAWTFFRAFIGGKPIAAIRRKDGVLEFTPAKYSAGLIETKYGVQILDDGSAMPEKKSGARVTYCLDTVGITLTPKIIQVIKALKEQYGFKDYRDIENTLKIWKKCKKCGFEGVMKGNFQTIKQKIGDVLKEDNIFSHLSCPKCDSAMLENTFPRITVPLSETLDAGEYERYFKYNYTPSRNSIIIEREVKSQMAKQRSLPIRWIGMAMAVLIIAIAGAIAYSILSQQGVMSNPTTMLNFCEQLVGAKAAPAANIIPG